MDAIYSGRCLGFNDRYVEPERIRDITPRLQESLEDTHKQIQVSVEAKRQRERVRRMKKTKCFEDELCHWRFRAGGKKLATTEWETPYAMGRPFKNHQGCERLNMYCRGHDHQGGARNTCSHMKFYAEASREADEELFDQIAHDGNVYEVKEFRGIRREDGVFEVLVQWNGFNEVEDADLSEEDCASRSPGGGESPSNGGEVLFGSEAGEQH